MLVDMRLCLVHRISHSSTSRKLLFMSLRRDINSASVLHKLYPRGQSEPADKCLACVKSLRACNSSISIFVFTQPICQPLPDSTTSDYYNKSTYFQLGRRFFSYCSSCGSRNEYESYFCRSKARILVPTEFDTIGSQGVLPMLNPDDVEYMFFLCEAVLRALRIPILTLQYT